MFGGTSGEPDIGSYGPVMRNMFPLVGIVVVLLSKNGGVSSTHPCFKASSLTLLADLTRTFITSD